MGVAAASALAVGATAGPSAADPPPDARHPPYKEMILRAVSASHDRKGASRRAIGDFITGNYSGFSMRHRALLTHHLRRLCLNGFLLVQSRRYLLPAVTNEKPTTLLARPRGRPPKIEDHGIERRKPGRPRKVAGVLPVAVEQLLASGLKRKPGRPRKAVSAAEGIVMLSGKPKPCQFGTNAAPVMTRTGKHFQVAGSFAAVQMGEKRKRGRPRKVIPAVESMVMLTGKRKRGRPPKHAYGNVQNTIKILHGVPSEIVMSDAPQLKRKRGRPPKSIDMYAKSSESKPELPGKAEGVAPSSIGKRKPGRPPKNLSAVLPSTEEINAPGRPPKHVAEVELVSSEKRRVGRPRKNLSDITQIKDYLKQPSSSILSIIPAGGKRKPGRPPKFAGVAMTFLNKRRPGRPPRNTGHVTLVPNTNSVVISPIKRKGGRPPKNITSPIKRKPGRPPKNAAVVASLAGKEHSSLPESSPIVTSLSTEKRKPGRPPKNAAALASLAGEEHSSVPESNPTIAGLSTEKRKRGRPRKIIPSDAAISRDAAAPEEM